MRITTKRIVGIAVVATIATLAIVRMAYQERAGAAQAAATVAAREHTVTVVGSAEKRWYADTATVILRVTARGQGRGASVEAASRALTKLRAELTAMGIKKGAMSHSNVLVVSTETVTHKRKPVLVCTAACHLKAEVASIPDLVAIGKIVDAQTEVRLVRTAFNRSDIEEIQNAVLTKALKKAKARAKLVTDVLGVKLGPAVRVSQVHSLADPRTPLRTDTFGSYGKYSGKSYGNSSLGSAGLVGLLGSSDSDTILVRAQVRVEFGLK